MNGIERKRGLCGGRAVVEGTGIETRVLLDRFMGGDSMSVLAKDYEISLREVDDAIRYECCKTCRCKKCNWAKKLKVTR